MFITIVYHKMAAESHLKFGTRKHACMHARTHAQTHTITKFADRLMFQSNETISNLSRKAAQTGFVFIVQYSTWP